MAFAQGYGITPKTKPLSELYIQTSDAPGGHNRFAGDIGLKYDLGDSLKLQVAIGKSFREGNLGGPSLRVYAGIKLKFSILP